MRIIHFRDLYPGISDSVVYNVTPQEYFQSDCYNEIVGQQTDPNTYFWTTEGPPPKDDPSDFSELYSRAIQCVHAYLERRGFPDVDAFGRPLWGPRETDYEKVIRSYSEDRTLSFHGPFNEPGIASLELIESLQREVIQPYPLWRLSYFDWDEGLIVYPDAVRAGLFSPSLGQREAIELWLPGHLARCEDHVREERIQFLFLRERLSQQFPLNLGEKIRVLEVFDSIRSNASFYSAWIFHDMREFRIVSLDGECRGFYPVGMNGEIGPKQWLAESEEVPYRLTWIYFEKKQPIEIEVMLIKPGSKGTITLSFPIDNVTSEAEIEKWCLEQG